uniref:Major capsid protein n=1 Tax=Dulem virus 50 TaxID=3145761 RepID=A0AAU8B0U9_9VIRU
MNIQNIKRKAQTALAATTVAVLSAPAMADGSLLDTVKTEMSGIKTEVLALGSVVVGISIAFALIRLGKKGANSL